MSKIVAQALLSIGAVKFSPDRPFLYASGLKGPMYCDNRMLLSHVEYREIIIDKFVSAILENKINFDLVGGVATAGIPYGAMVADRLKMPMVYVRPKPKGHGKMNQVEGAFCSKQIVLLFEDLVNQGASLTEAIQGILNADLLVLDCFCIVDYQTPVAKMRMLELGIKLHSLTNFSVLVETAFELELITEQGRTELLAWHSDPVKWSKRFE